MSYRERAYLRSQGVNPDRFHEIRNNMVDIHMTTIRDKQTRPFEFSHLVRKVIGPILAAEATKHIHTEYHRVATSAGIDVHHDGIKQQQAALVAAIPRAGLAFTDAFLDVLSPVEYGLVHVRRDEETGKPVRGEVKLPQDCNVPDIFILDPMLATGGSMTAAIDAIHRRGGDYKHMTTVSLVASVAGVAAVHAVSPEITVVTAALDPDLNDRFYIIPGLGDAGDRLYGTGSSGIATLEYKVYNYNILTMCGRLASNASHAPRKDSSWRKPRSLLKKQKSQ